MPPLLRNLFAVIAGIAACIFLNGMLLGLLMRLNPPPEGFDANDLSTYTVLRARHLLNPFLAHAVPSLIGGFIAALLAATRKMSFALAVGGVHLLGGLMAAFIIPAPAWFITLDLVVAYLPMAALGGRVGRQLEHLKAGSAL